VDIGPGTVHHVRHQINFHEKEDIMTLQSKRVVVVGGTSGIGLAVTRAAHGEGAEVVVASARQSSVDSALEEFHGDVSAQTLDVSDVAAVAAFFGEVGAFDHLAYTAGDALVTMPLSELDIEKARSSFQIRFFGALSVVGAAAPHIRDGGSITLTSGASSVRPRPGGMLRSSVCGAVESLTRALAVELAPIRVNAVRPGVVRSPLWVEMDEAEREQMYQNVGNSLLVGHVGETDELARAYTYCMLQTFATGSVLNVDGGLVLV
jgi:NAD(P)-dependent dehydrogenase (short-subunit alcohol dehydrogenase family)